MKIYIDINANMCIAVEISIVVHCSTSFIVFDIYMPYQSVENEDIYFEKLGYINTFIDEIQCTNYAVIGDWNANLGNSGTNIFKDHMIDFCRENELSISSHLLLPNDSYTHIHAYNGNLHYSWLDHVVSSHDFHQSINDIAICYNISDEDHIPISFTMNVEHLPAISDITNDLTAKINWDCISKSNCDLYNSNSDINLGKVLIPVNAVCCDILNCSDESHRPDLDIFFKNITGALIKSLIHQPI